MEQIRAAVAANEVRGIVLADAAYGINTEFRDGLTSLGLYTCGGSARLDDGMEPGKKPLPARPRGKMGRPPRLLQRTPDHRPVSVKQLRLLPSVDFSRTAWREGVDRSMIALCRSSSTASASGLLKAEPHAEEWLLIEWPQGEIEPIKYWISTLLRHSAQSSGKDGQAALDHRTGLPGVEAGIRTGSLKAVTGEVSTTTLRYASQLMGSRSPSGPVFPSTCAGNTGFVAPGQRRTSASRGQAAYAPSGIIRIRSQRCELFWRACYCENCRIVPTADLLQAERRHRNPLRQCRSAARSVVECAMPPHSVRADWLLHGETAPVAHSFRRHRQTAIAASSKLIAEHMEPA